MLQNVLITYVLGIFKYFVRKLIPSSLDEKPGIPRNIRFTDWNPQFSRKISGISLESPNLLSIFLSWSLPLLFLYLTCITFLEWNFSKCFISIVREIGTFERNTWYFSRKLRIPIGKPDISWNTRFLVLGVIQSPQKGHQHLSEY
jgi:hypothetical protein